MADKESLTERTGEKEEKKVPRHVTIIMDGNGRWAGRHGKERCAGHVIGKESVRVCCEYAARRGIEYLSLFAFSTENWSRSGEEVSALMHLLLNSVLNEESTMMKNNIKFRMIGERKGLGSNLVEAIDNLEAKTASNTGMTLIIFVNYSGKWDILQAAERISRDAAAAISAGFSPAEIDESRFASYLSTASIPDPDLMIRTSGEQRISNYMLWQCAYTEFYFTDTLWPDFREREFELALEAFRTRDRRFGRVKETRD